MRSSSSGTSFGFQLDSLLCWEVQPGSPTPATATGYSDQVAVIGGNPLFDGLLGWLDGLDLFDNYDPVLLRRIQRHIKFRLPDASMRRELFALHLHNPDRVKADYAILAELSKGLSGGDILNGCVNAIHVGSVDVDPAKWRVKQEMLEREIREVKKAKAEHSGDKGKSRRRIGFQPS